MIKKANVQFNEEEFKKDVERGFDAFEALALQGLTITSLYRDEPKAAPALNFKEPVEDSQFQYPVQDDGFVSALAGIDDRIAVPVKKTKRVEIDRKEQLMLDEEVKKMLPGNPKHVEAAFMTKSRALAISAIAMGCMFYLGWPSTPEAHASAPQKAVEAQEPAAEKEEAAVKVAEPACPTLDAELGRICPEQYEYAKQHCRKIHTDRNKTSCALIFASATEQEEYHLKHPDTKPKVEERTCDFVGERDGKCIPSTRYNAAAAEQFAKAEEVREAAARKTEGQKMDEFGNVKTDRGEPEAVSVETMKKDREDAKNLHGLTLVNTKTMTGLSAQSLKRLLDTEKSYICDELPMVMERRLLGQQQMRDAERKRRATDEEIVKIETFMAITAGSIDELRKFSEAHCK